jgi:hypothetical protein
MTVYAPQGLQVLLWMLLRWQTQLTVGQEVGNGAFNIIDVKIGKLDVVKL